jgi:hypothetical protein
MTTARSALLTAFMLGRSGHKSMDWFDNMVKKVEENDSAAWREIAVLSREVASLRKEVEASRSIPERARRMNYTSQKSTGFEACS